MRMVNRNYRYQNIESVMEFYSIFFLNILWRQQQSITINQAACLLILYVHTLSVCYQFGQLHNFFLKYFHLFPVLLFFVRLLCVLLPLVFLVLFSKNHHHYCWNGHGQMEYSVPIRKRRIFCIEISLLNFQKEEKNCPNKSMCIQWFGHTRMHFIDMCFFVRNDIWTARWTYTFSFIRSGRKRIVMISIPEIRAFQ